MNFKKVFLDSTQLIKQKGIALTGGIACGKSLVARLLTEKGYVVIDADKLAREVTEPGSSGLAQLVEEFGPSVLEGGRLNRGALRLKIAGDEQARARLNSLLHPQIRTAYLKKVDSLSQNYHFYEAALIFENNLQGDFYQVWLCDCSEESQISRIMARDGASREYAESLLRIQWPRQKKLPLAEVVINTEQNVLQIEEQLASLLSQLKGAKHASS